MKRFSKKSLALLVMAVVAAALAVAGYAYFKGTGSGTGTASVGNASAQDMTIHATVTGTLYPGDSTGATVSFTVDNPETFAQKLSKISLDSISGAPVGCSAVVGSDFSMADVTVGADGDIAPSASGQALSETGTLKMLDNGDQSKCEGASLTFHFTAS